MCVWWAIRRNWPICKWNKSIFPLQIERRKDSRLGGKNPTGVNNWKTAQRLGFSSCGECRKSAVNTHMRTRQIEDGNRQITSNGHLWASRPFQRVHKVNTVFLLILKCYLPFLLSLEYTPEFSRGHMTWQGNKGNQNVEYHHSSH